MEATQLLNDSILESDEEENKEETERKSGRPLAKLCILKNEHIPETELPLFLGDNVVGRDPNACALLLSAPSISKQHATICISVYKRRGCHNEVDVEALIWDLGSMNGTRKGHLKLTPNVRYALSERERLVMADIPCQYVSCTIDSPKGDMMTPVSRNAGVNARLPDASGEKRGDTSTGSKKCVNRGSKSRVSLPGQEDTRKTPVRTSCLSFEKTPTQPQGTLVPESDSDSDEEKGDRRRKALVSDSDSHKSGPTCSTFLSPTNKIVPESEDESPITPSSSTKNRPSRHVSFSTDEPDVEMGQLQLKNKKTLAIVDDSDEEEERAALEGRKSEESEQHVPGKQESNVSLTGEDEMSLSSPAVLTDAIPVFDMDSDTDMEGEEEKVPSAGPVTLNTNQEADQPPNTAQFHMDSDTDVDEDALHEVPKCMPSSAEHAKPQAEGITMDSDTDVDDDAMSDAAIKAKSTSLQSTHAADSSPSTQRNDIQRDSDTDIDEQEEKQCETNNSCPKINETPTRLDIKPTGPESAPAAPHSLNLDSDTDDEAIPAPAISELSVVYAVTESVTTADAGANLGVQFDSDTDVEGDSPHLIPVVVSTLSGDPGITSKAVLSDSDADTDVDESSVAPAGDGVNPASLRVDCDTEKEVKEVDFGEAGENQIPSLCRKSTSGLLVPLQQNCSTPVQVSEGELEDMETQAFLIPSSGSFRRARPIALSPCIDSLQDDLCVVAETQSFILQTRDGQGNPRDDRNKDPTQSSVEKGKQPIRGRSFQLGLSDSSHLEAQAQALAMENTQAFVSVVEGGNLEDTQAYANRSSLENDSNLQAYGEDEEPSRCPVMSAKEGRVDLALEATQSYISEPDSDSEVKTEEDERKNTAIAETQPFYLPTSSTLAIAETQPMHFGVAETQPMATSGNEESDVEDPIPGPRKRKAKQLWLEDEQTQPLTNSELSTVETQPMDKGEDGESDEEDFILGPRKRRAKPLQLEEETQSLASSGVSLVETQPMVTGEDRESGDDDDDDDDDYDSVLGPRKKKAKPIQEEDTQPLTNSEASTVETKTGLQSQRGKGRQTEAGTSGTTIGRRRVTRSRLRDEEEPAECSEPSKRPTRGKMKALPTTRGRRGKSRADEEEEEEEQTKKARGKKYTRHQKDSKEEEEMLKTENNNAENNLIKEQEEAREEQDKLERERKDKEEQEIVQVENAERLRLEQERAEMERIERERQEEDEKKRADRAQKEERLARERKEKEEKERLEREKAEREEKVRIEKERKKAEIQEKERIEKERKKEEKLRLEREKAEREEKERIEKEEKERLERDKAEREEKERIEKERNKAERQEKERIEKERKKEEKLRLEREREEKERIENEREKEEKERLERDKAEREEKERIEKERKKAEIQEKERIEKERKKEEKLRLEREKAEREEKERIEKERKKAERQEKERIEKERKKEERQEKERIEKEEKLRLEREKAEREKLEREEKERTKKEREEEKERLKTAKRERKGRAERERKEEEEKQENEAKEKQTKEQQENNPKTPAKGRRAAPCTTEPHQDSTISAIDDVPARRTRSRSNSSNSVSSERSASSVNTQGSRGKGRGRGAKRTSGPPQAAIAKSSNRRRTVAAEPTQQDSYDISPQGVLSRSNSEICSLSSQSRGRGGRQRGRGRKTESDSIPPINSQSGQDLTPKPTARGRKGRRAEESSEVPHENEIDSQQASTTRGRQRANANGSKPAAGDERSPSSQECVSEDSPLPEGSVRGRSQKAIKSETVETPVAPAVSDGEEAKGKRNGRKRELEANTDEEASCSSKISKAKEKAQTEAKKDEGQVQVKRKGRASGAQAKKNAKNSPAESEVKEESEQVEEGTVERRVRGRPSLVQKPKKEKQEESGPSFDQDPHVKESEPQSPTSSVSRKRQALANSSPVAKAPRSSSASPAAGGQLRAGRQAYKVLFTGVVDEDGERVLTCLGGSMANGVTDMNCLVTDKVRRTVKFLCAVAKGVPIVNTHWLNKSGKAGSFLSPNAFVVKDQEQEKKFNFSLQESLRIASSQPLLQGYEIHVTKSVKPEPVHMKDIISCSGATFLPKMPSSHKPQTVVISCEEDWLLCGPALSQSLPVVTAEFILTGILRQKLDLQSHKLCAPANTPQLAGGKGRSRKKT